MKYASDYGNKEVSFVLNSTEEVAGLPTHEGNNVGFGSDATIVPTADIYILTPDDTWTKFGGEA